MLFFIYSDHSDSRSGQMEQRFANQWLPQAQIQ
jgi:hypothetical protein